MDQDQEGQRHFVDWLSNDEYSRLKTDYINEFVPYYKEQLEGVSELSSLSEKEKEIGAKMISTFLFGVKMAYDRTGNTYEDELCFDSSENPNYKSIAYDNTNKAYVVKLSWFKNEVENASKGLKRYFKVSGGADNVELLDSLELGGVEEAAHLIFFDMKKADSYSFVKDQDFDDDIRYYTREVEYRALLWKVNYAKHYMPQYYDSLKDRFDRVTEALRRKREKLHESS